MTINLQKGQRIEIGLSKVGVGLGWQPSESGFDFDLDASAFMLGKNGKVLDEKHFVFYNNLQSPDGAVASSGDELTGGSTEGDDETLMVDLTRVSPSIEEIVFAVTIHEADVRKQNFGQVRNSYIRIYDAISDQEICKYELDEDFSVETAIEFGRLYKRGSEWKFEAIGSGYTGGLQHFVGKYT